MHIALSAVLLLATSNIASALPTKDAIPAIAKRYAGGACGFHWRQYQKNEGPGDQSHYRFDVTIVDANHNQIGGASLVDSPAGIDSQLPYVLVLTAGNVDQDPVSFAYAAQHFNSNSGQCSTGAYDSGSRQGDCSFSC